MERLTPLLPCREDFAPYRTVFPQPIFGFEIVAIVRIGRGTYLPNFIRSGTPIALSSSCERDCVPTDVDATYPATAEYVPGGVGLLHARIAGARRARPTSSNADRPGCRDARRDRGV